MNTQSPAQPPFAADHSIFSSPTTDPRRLAVLSNVRTLFGEAVVARLDDARFPPVFKKSLRQLNIINFGEIVAAPCGGGLCALVCSLDNLEPLNEFDRLNPGLNGTMRTVWNRLLFVWIRIKGWMPNNQELVGALWISAGSLPISNVDDTSEFVVSAKGSAVKEINFLDLRWPGGAHDVFLLARMEAKHGAVFSDGPDGKIVFSLDTVVHFFAENLTLKYLKQCECFTINPPGCKPSLIDKAKLAKYISDWVITRAAAEDIHRMDENLESNLLVRLKQVCAVDPIDPADSLQMYLRTRLEQKYGGSVTTAELLADYKEFCNLHGGSAYPERLFYRRVTAAIREQLGICKNHCIPRQKPDGSPALRYGFKHLALKAQGSLGATEERKES